MSVRIDGRARCATVLLGWLLAGSAFAGEIDGTVVGAAGTPRGGVTVRIPALGAETVTDAHGHFHFSDVAPGRYRVETADGAAARTVSVGEGVASVTLREEAMTTETVVVRASPLLGRSPLDIAQPVTVLAGDALMREVSVNLGDTVANELGMSATSFGQGASRPMIRGLGDNRVRVLADGIGTLDVSTVSDDHAVMVEPVLVDQIEILKGPATLLYGTGAIGGAVNVIDGRIPERRTAHGVEARAELRGATANDERSGVVRLDGNAGEHFAWHVDGYRRRTGDYKPGHRGHDHGGHDDHDDHDHDHDAAHGSRIENSDLATAGGAFGLSWVGSRGFAGASLSFFDTEYGVPGGHGHGGHDEHHDEHDDHHVRVAQRQTRFDVAASLADPFAGFERLRVRLGASDYEHRELEDGDIGTVFNNDAWEGRAELTHRPVLGGWRGALGVQTSHRAFEAIGDEAFTPPTDSTETGVFWVGEREFERFKLELGSRAERVTHDAEGFAERSISLRNLSAGIIVPFGEPSFAMTVGRYERAPVAEELYSNGPHLATGTFEIGDPTLGREASNTVEAGFRDDAGTLRWSLTAYRTRFDDYIFLEATGDEDAETHLPVHAYRQRDAEFTGFEAEAIMRAFSGAWGQVDVRVFGDAVRAAFADGTAVPRIPPRRIGLSTELQQDRWYGRLRWTRYAAQERVAPGETHTDGYSMLDADLSYRLGQGRSDWLFFVRGTNLLDEDARRHTSFLKDVAPLPGRSIQVGARVSL